MVYVLCGTLCGEGISKYGKGYPEASDHYGGYFSGISHRAGASWLLYRKYPFRRHRIPGSECTGTCADDRRRCTASPGFLWHASCYFPASADHPACRDGVRDSMRTWISGSDPGLCGATLGFALRSKDKNVKELGFSTGFTALCGVTEPAVYGIIVKYKQIIPAVVLGGVSGGLFAGIFHLKRYAIATPGIPALPTFMGEDPNNIFIAIGTVCIAFFVSATAAFFLGAEKKPAKAAAGADGQGMESQSETQVNLPAAEPNTLYAPLEGEVVPLEQVPDETFASGVLGQGFAVKPSKPCVYAPFDGTVIQTMDSKHAVGLQSKDGMEVLIHVGIDTVDMNGEGFDLKCNEGDEVKRGQLLLSFDPEAIRRAGHPDITVVAVTNSFDYASVNVEKTGPAEVMDKILTVTNS